MKKALLKITSFLLVFCIVFNFSSVVFAEKGDYPQIEYYSLKVSNEDFSGFSDKTAVTFMVCKASKDAKEDVYIKAEEFPYLFVGVNYMYNQTDKECAYVSEYLNHVVRFKFNSKKVYALYMGGELEYEAPFKAIYENSVAWIPFEFAVNLFGGSAVPTEDSIIITAPRNNPLAVGNMINSYIDTLGFDWVGEVGQSLFKSNLNHLSASAAYCANQLLSFEVGAWGSVLMKITGNSYAYDAEFAEKIAKIYITPSEQEVAEVEQYRKDCKLLTDGIEAQDNIATAEIRHGTISETLSQMREIIPSSEKDDVIKRANNAMKDAKFAASAQDFFIEYQKCAGDIDSIAKFLNFAMEFLEFMDFYNLYANKSDRAVESLKYYSNKSSHDEAQVFKEYAETSGNDFKDGLKRYFLDNIDDFLNEGTSLAGAFGLQLQIANFAWNLISNSVGYLKHGIDMTEYRLVSDYAIEYQNESLDFYYKDRAICKAGTNSEKYYENAVNSLYAYLKFSYIARNAAAASYGEIKGMGKNQKTMENNEKILNDKNKKIASYLTALEEKPFLPSVAKGHEWGDTLYVQAIRTGGELLDEVSQDTPVSEELDIPEEPEKVITSAEAAKLVEKTIDKFTWGIMTEYLSDFFSFRTIDTYEALFRKLYVVRMSVMDEEQALFFVPYDGSAVYYGQRKDGSYTYFPLDFMGFSWSDIPKIISQYS